MGLTTMVPLFLLLAIAAPGTHGADKPPNDPMFSYDFLYNEGVNSYLNEDWEKCVFHLEAAIEDWHWSRSTLAQCREQCHNESQTEELISGKLDTDTQFYEAVIRNGLCLIKCKKRQFGSRMDRDVDPQVNDDFHMNKPYDYLQMCYYKLERVKEAADAAATVLTAQPSHEVMQNNLKFYLTHDIQPESVINRELKDYGKDYIRGSLAYNEGQYRATINYMEKSLEEFYKLEQQCRRLCENSFDQKLIRDFVLTVANQWTYTLRCKRRCERTHSNLFGEVVENFHASYYNYLQFAYNKENEWVAASEALASALLLEPEDPVHNSNKQLYLSSGHATEDMFVPRKSAVEYKERKDAEIGLIEFIDSSFLFLDDDDDTLADVEDDGDVMNSMSVSPVLSGGESNSSEDQTTRVIVKASGNGEL